MALRSERLSVGAALAHTTVTFGKRLTLFHFGNSGSGFSLEGRNVNIGQGQTFLPLSVELQGRIFKFSHLRMVKSPGSPTALNQLFLTSAVSKQTNTG